MIHPLTQFIYNLGFRPSPGSIFFSPSLDSRLATLEALEAFRKANEQYSRLFTEEYKRKRYSGMLVLDKGMSIISPLHPCKVCAKTDDEKPMCFRGEDWCCEIHRKIVVGELPAEEE